VKPDSKGIRVSAKKHRPRAGTFTSTRSPPLRSCIRTDRTVKTSPSPPGDFWCDLTNWMASQPNNTREGLMEMIGEQFDLTRADMAEKENKQAGKIIDLLRREVVASPDKEGVVVLAK
jgi:hypothetical protein